MNRKYARGFTLIEIAIVLVIIGLLLGGILKGQELITSARVRNLISQQDGVKAAFFGFQDRFRALPGDYTAATTNIANVTGGGVCGLAATRLSDCSVLGGFRSHPAHVSRGGKSGRREWLAGVQVHQTATVKPDHCLQSSQK